MQIFLMLAAAIVGGIISGMVVKSFWKIDVESLYKAQRRMVDKHFEYAKMAHDNYSLMMAEMNVVNRRLTRRR